MYIGFEFILKTIDRNGHILQYPRPLHMRTAKRTAVGGLVVFGSRVVRVCCNWPE